MPDVVSSEMNVAEARPLRLRGTRSYLQHWLEEQQGCADVLLIEHLDSFSIEAICFGPELGSPTEFELEQVRVRLSAVTPVGIDVTVSSPYFPSQRLKWRHWASIVWIPLFYGWIFKTKTGAVFRVPVNAKSPQPPATLQLRATSLERWLVSKDEVEERG